MIAKRLQRCVRPVVWLAVLLGLSAGLWRPVHAQRAELRAISEVQGTGDVSPYLNQRVSVEGVVTGVRADRNSAGTVYYTLFIQALPGSEDGDPATSDGLAVFLGRTPPDYRPGDHVRVSGRVTEFFGLTELDDDNLSIELIAVDVPQPTPIRLGLFDGPPEALEGMLVTPGDAPARVIGATHSGCGFAVVPAERNVARVYRRSAADTVWPAVPVIAADETACDLPDLKTGDRVSGLFGPLTYDFDQYKIVLQSLDYLAIEYAPYPTIEPPASPVADQFSLITFNLHDHFDARDGGNPQEPLPSPKAVERKAAQIAATVGPLAGCPTIVAVQEVENALLLRDLSDRLVPTCGFAYAVLHVETPDVRGIDQGYLVDPRRVFVGRVISAQACTHLPTGVVDATLTCGGDDQPLFDRPPLVAHLRVDGYPLTVINNHFKSKREGEDETAAWRLAQATYVAALVENELAQDPQTAVIVLGDFNDYEQSAPLDRLRAAGLHDALAAVPDGERYSYVFDGAAQLLDYVLVSEALQPAVVSATILHLNADYPVALSESPPAEQPALRASDHDVPYVVIEQPGPPVAIPTPLPLPTVVVVDVPTASAMLATLPVTPAVEASPAPVAPESGNNSPLWLIAVGAALLFGVGLGLMLRRR